MPTRQACLGWFDARPYGGERCHTYARTPRGFPLQPPGTLSFALGAKWDRQSSTCLVRGRTKFSAMLMRLQERCAAEIGIASFASGSKRGVDGLLA